MNWKNFTRDYLSFNRKERIAVIVIAGLMVFIILAPKIISMSARNDIVKTDTTWFATVRNLEQKSPDRKSTRLNSSHVVTSRMPSSA